MTGSDPTKPHLPPVFQPVYTEASGLTVVTKDVPAEPDRSQLVDAHYYEILHPQGKTVIEFQNGPIPKVGVNGVTTEALVAIAIDRTEKLNDKFPCAENEAAIEDLKNALFQFQERTRNRQARGVEGQMKV